jgi:hypothetical protein
MTAKERREFLASADDETLASVLAAKPFLSGLKPAEANALRDRVTRQWFPDEVQRKQKLERALEQLHKANETYWQVTPEFVDSDLDDFEAHKAAVKAAVAGEDV